MTLFLTKNKFIGVSAAVLLALAASPAYAGFQWKGPIMPPAMSTQAQDMPAPITETPSTDSAASGDINWQTGNMPAVKAETVEEAAPVGMPAASMSASPADADVVTGFGADLPLVIAMQQVLPAGYKVSFTKNVFPGTTVSWNGGKPWKDVLHDMIAPRDLTFDVQNDTVVIMPAPLPGAPSDTAPMALTGAPTGAAPAADKNADAISIRRQKPSNILRKLGLTSSSASSPAPAEQSPAPAVKAEQTKEASAPAAPAAPKAAAVSNTAIEWSPVPAADTLSAAAPVALAKSPASSAEPAPLSATPEPTWQGAKGQTLRAVLKEWSETAGVELYWAIDYDYRLTDDKLFGGSYDEAVAKLLDGFTSSRPQPYGELHQSAEGPRVLVVKSYDLAG